MLRIDNTSQIHGQGRGRAGGGGEGGASGGLGLRSVLVQHRVMPIKGLSHTAIVPRLGGCRHCKRLAQGRGVTGWRNLGAAVRADEPERLALVDLGGEAPPRLFTYGDIERNADAAAHALLQRGLGRGDRVAIASSNRAEFLFAFLGAMRAGLVSVPVNTKLPAATVRLVLEDCDARLVFADRAHRGLLPDGLPVVEMEEWAAFAPAAPFEAVVPEPADPAMFLYTSGSTGRPKGVVLSHRSHLWVLDVRTRRPGMEDERVLVAAPLYHMNGLAMAQLTFASGGVLVLLPGFTARSYIEAAAQWRVTALTSVPPMVAMMLQEPDLLATLDLSSVQSIRMGVGADYADAGGPGAPGVSAGGDLERVWHDGGGAGGVRAAPGRVADAGYQLGGWASRRGSSADARWRGGGG